MIQKLRKKLPAKVILNQKGFTLIELLIILAISLIIGGIVTIGLLAIFSSPKYEGQAYSDIEGQRYYNMVRLPDEGIIGGVCSGIGYKFGVSPWIPRIGFIIVTCLGGAGVLAYAIFFLFMKSAHTPDDFLQRTGG